MCRWSSLAKPGNIQAQTSWDVWVEVCKAMAGAELGPGIPQCNVCSAKLDPSFPAGIPLPFPVLTVNPRKATRGLGGLLIPSCTGMGMELGVLLEFSWDLILLHILWAYNPNNL